MHNGSCYPDGSYFLDENVNDNNENFTCVLPDATLTTGQWVRAGGGATADCSNNNNSGLVARGGWKGSIPASSHDTARDGRKGDPQHEILWG